MATYYPNGSMYIPGLLFDEGQLFGMSMSTAGNLALVVNAPGSGAQEVMTVSSGGAVTMSTGTWAFSTGGVAMKGLFRVATAITPNSVPAASSTASRVQLFNVTGLTTADNVISINLPPAWVSPGVALGEPFVSSSAGLGTTWINTTTAAITPSSGSYDVVFLRS